VLTIVRLLHVLAMAGWLGATLWFGGDARRSLTGGQAEAMAFLGRARAALVLDRAAGAVAIFTGLFLVHLAHAWPPRPGLLIGAGLALVRAGLTDALLGPGLRKIATGLAGGAAPSSLAPVAQRLATVAGAAHLAWLGALAGMMVR